MAKVSRGNRFKILALLAAAVVFATGMSAVDTYKDASNQVHEAAKAAARAAAITRDDGIAESLAASIACSQGECNVRSEVNIGSSAVSAHVEIVVRLPFVGDVVVGAVHREGFSTHLKSHLGTA